jgi:hypothetical protein
MQMELNYILQALLEFLIVEKTIVYTSLLLLC